MKLFLVLYMIFATFIAQADDRSDFCHYFVETYKAIKGNLAYAPICPPIPPIPSGSTAAHEGIKAGMKSAGK